MSQMTQMFVNKTPWIYFIYTMTLCQEIWTVNETQKRKNRGTHLTGIKKLTRAINFLDW